MGSAENLVIRARSAVLNHSLALRACIWQPSSYDQVVDANVQSFDSWRSVPAPKRGALIRDLGNALRDNLEPLGELVSLEMGKIRAEGIGEVQEMIDICDFAIGLSRQLCGSTMHSERPGHRMYEQWHPLGPAVGSRNSVWVVAILVSRSVATLANREFEHAILNGISFRHYYVCDRA